MRCLLLLLFEIDLYSWNPKQMMSNPECKDDCCTDEAESCILPTDCVALLHQVWAQVGSICIIFQQFTDVVVNDASVGVRLVLRSNVHTKQTLPLDGEAQSIVQMYDRT